MNWGQNVGYKGKQMKNIVGSLTSFINCSAQILFKLAQNIISSRKLSKVQIPIIQGSKTRTKGQINEKPCLQFFMAKIHNFHETCPLLLP